MTRRRSERPGIGPIGGRGLSGAVGGGLARLERQERRAWAVGATQGRAHLGLRLSVVSALSVGLMSVLLVRLWTVQVINHGSYRSGALQEMYKTVYTPAPRGEIVASGGEVLASDRAEEVVTVEPAIDPDDAKLWVAKYPTGESNLAALLDIPESQIAADLNSPQNVPHQPVVVAIGAAQGVSEQAVVQITEYPSRYPGVAVSRQYVRVYPQGSLAALVLGYTGAGPATVADSAGKAVPSPLDLAEYARYNGPESDPTFGEDGLEEQYQQYLFGVPGKEVEQVDPSGNPLGVVSTTPATQGDTVVLNLDEGLEQTLSGELAAQVAALRSGKASGTPVPAPDAAAVVMNARTGAVLAIASYPGYDDNDWVGGISERQYQQLVDAPGHPLNDYAVADPQPPGSDFKLASATAALDDGLITPSYEFDDTGYYSVGDLTLHDNEGEGPFGDIDVSQALTVSSDDFFYNVGALFWEAYQNDPKYPYGETPIQEVAERYGLGVSDGVDLPPADVATGQVDSPAWRTETGQSGGWYIGDNMEMAFGQGQTEITPLELATAYATFAEHGVRHAPELAGEIVSPTGAVLEKIAPKVTGHVTYASSADYDAILQGFEGVTQSPSGTGYQAFEGFDFNAWNVAGKTGTATTNAAQPTSWFVAFGGPKHQSPAYVVAVEVNQGGYGATASAPIARDVFDYLHAHGVPATLRP
jgi:penicillin-binding protein 2